MNATERLIDSSNNRLARALLRSADLDEAPNNTVAKVALALGLGSTALVTTVATGAAASTSAIAGTSSIAGAGVAASVGTVAAVPAATAVTAVGMLKVMAIVSLTCGTLSYGGVKLALKVSDKPAVATVAARPARVAMQKTTATRSVAAFAPVDAVNPPAPPPPQTEAASPRESNAPALGRQSIQSNSAEPAVAQRSMAEHTATNPTTRFLTQPATAAHTAAFPGDEARPAGANQLVGKPQSDATKPASDLEREVMQLDHARATLAAGQPAQALRELDAYRAQTPRGTLAAESVVLRVKALLAMGQRSAAEREASPLLMAAPQSLHAQRLRELLSAQGIAP